MSDQELNISQKEAVEYIDGPLIIVAGAGTGKTTVITRKIQFLIKHKLASPGEILALTFNEKAAAEMQARVDEMMDVGYLDMQISTFHAFCERILEKYGLDIGLPNKFRVVTETDAWLMMRRELNRFNLDYYRPLANPMRHMHEMIGHFSKCKDEMIDPESYLDYAQNIKLDMDTAEQEEKSRLAEIAGAYHTYNRILLEKNALDFGDLIYYTNLLLDKRKNILSILMNKFRYILVDEFQDVNWAQYELIRKLSGKGIRLTVVGDDDQSIYAFRGASVSNILRFKDDFPNAKEIVLNVNYRSEQDILDKAYELIQNNNPDRLEVKLSIDKRLKAALPNNAGSNEQCVITTGYNNLDEEVAYVINEISNIKRVDKEAVWDDFALLVRANTHAEPFLNALEKTGIPYEFLAASGLFRQPIVLDCFNFFKAISDHHESRSVYRLLTMPLIAIKENDLQKITSFAKLKSISYYEALKRPAETKLSPEGSLIADKFLSLIHDGMINSRDNKPSVVLYKFVDSTGYLKHLSSGVENGDRNAIRQIFQLNQFLEYIVNYESATPGASVPDFLEHFENVIDSGDTGIIKQPEDTGDSVNIMTVHTAKGLEYKYVFVVNLVEDRFPTRRRGEGIILPDQLVKERLPEGDSLVEEERRLLYVAMTRAKKRLYLTYAENYGGVRNKKVSRFLAEIDMISGEKSKITHSSFQEAPDQKMPAMEAAEFAYNLPKLFSFSQIQKYWQCPYQYKLGQILKLPTRGSASLSFGISMHNTLERFFKRLVELNSVKQESLFQNAVTAIKNDAVIAPTIEEMLKLYDECWIPDWYNNRNQRELFYDKGKKILKRFYDTQTGKWAVPIALETQFKALVGRYLIRGRIDRVDMMTDGRLEIIDYKTGQSKDKVGGEDKDQLLIYQIALSQLPEFSAIGSPGQLTYHYLEDNHSVSFLGGDKDLQRVEEKIVNIIEKISNRDFKATPEKHTCAYCDFRDVCDFRA